MSEPTSSLTNVESFPNPQSSANAPTASALPPVNTMPEIQTSDRPLEAETEESLRLPRDLITRIREVVGERCRVEGLIEAADSGRAEVKDYIYDRIRADYDSRLDAVQLAYAPLKDEASEILRSIRGQELALRGTLGDLEDELSELRFRCRVGEFGEEELAGAEKTRLEDVAGCEAKLEVIRTTYSVAESLLGADATAVLEAEADAGPAESQLQEALATEAVAYDDALQSGVDDGTPLATVSVPSAEGALEVSVAQTGISPASISPAESAEVESSALPPVSEVVPEPPSSEGRLVDAIDQLASEEARLPMLAEEDEPETRRMERPRGLEAETGSLAAMASVETSRAALQAEAENNPMRLGLGPEAGFGRLILTTQDGEETYDLSESGLTLGRSKANHIVLPEPGVSRRHATVSWRDGVAVIEDHSSGGGVLVNGEFVDRHSLSPTDRIQIVSFQLEYRA